MRKQILVAVAVSLLACAVPERASGAGADSRSPRSSSDLLNQTPSRPMEPRNVPDFAQDASETRAMRARAGGTALQVGAESTTLPVETRLKLVVENLLDARTSQPGDSFEAHVKDDLFIGRSLLLPRGSLVRGRVMEVSKPRLVSRAARIGLRLDQIVTPTGEIIPLDAALEFHKGMTNKQGQLDPGTNFGTRVESDLKTVTGLNSKGGARSALMAANIATLGAPAVATAIGSSAVALFRSGDNVSVQPGQEIEILLTNDLGLQLN